MLPLGLSVHRTNVQDRFPPRISDALVGQRRDTEDDQDHSNDCCGFHRRHGRGSERPSAAPHEVKDKHDQRDKKQEVNKTACHMESKSPAPDEQ